VQIDRVSPVADIVPSARERPVLASRLHLRRGDLEPLQSDPNSACRGVHILNDIRCRQITGLVRIAPIEYCATMSVLLRQIARYVTKRVASDPRARENVVRAARSVVEEAKRIAKEDDRAYAAGRALRRALDKLPGNR
jgi:hypothetical protein